MYWLAWKTLYHEKTRLAITIAGITFSTVLVQTQIGIYFGMMGNATAVIRHSDSDIWITPKNIQNFDFANPVPEERINKMKALPEVLWADRLIVTWGFLKLANGGLEQVQIIGYNPNTGRGAPWSMVSGRTEDVKGGSYMILDKSAEKRLGSLKVGSVWELSGRRFRLVGLSNDIKSFTTTPIVFMSYGSAQDLPGDFIDSHNTSYIMAKLKNGEKTRAVVAHLRDDLRDNEILSKKGFILKTIKYWTIQTGIGMSFFLSAVLGLIIGGAIAGQTIYANTMQHLREYGTLKAMGARNGDIYGIIFSQAAISAFCGYSLGSVCISLARGWLEQAGVPLYLDIWLIMALFVIVVLTCVCSAWFSVRKIRTLDPVLVFRG